MARKRFVTSEMSTDEDLADIASKNPTAALMWPWFITAFDDWGRIETTSPMKIKLEVFPAFPYTADDMNQAIQLYQESGIVYGYSAGNKQYIAIEPCKFYKYQTYIREKKRVEDNSNYPAPINPPWEKCTQCRASARTNAQYRADARKCIPSPSPSPSPSIVVVEDDERIQVGKVFKCFHENISSAPGQTQYDELNHYLDEGVSPDVIIEAIKDSVGAKYNKWGLLQTKLKDCVENKIMTIDQYNARKAEREKDSKVKNKPKQSRIPQAENFEQRKYDDDFYNNLYRNK